MTDLELISQAKLARKAGVSESMVSRVLRHGRCPSIRTAQKLAKALGLSLEEFLDLLDSLPAKQ